MLGMILVLLAAPVQVRVTPAARPCLQAALRSSEAASVADGGDVLVLSRIEMTRALESGQAEDGTEVDLLRIPWVLRVPAGNPRGLRGLADLASAGGEVAVLAGPAAYEARRALGGLPRERVRESLEPGVLDAAPAALVPLSLAGPGERLKVADVPPLVITAAVATGSARRQAAALLVARLQSLAPDLSEACQP